VEERVDLGPCQALRHGGETRRWVVLLPGRAYPTRAPALWFAREAAMARGWSALEVLGEPGEHADPLDWERRCADRALEAAADSDQVVVIGKSLASLLAGEVADRDLPAVWLTPLLTENVVIDGLGRSARPVLLAGGGADPTWRRHAIPAERAIHVLELPGADHGLQVAGDLAGSIAVLQRLCDATSRFLDRIG